MHLATSINPHRAASEDEKTSNSTVQDRTPARGPSRRIAFDAPLLTTTSPIGARTRNTNPQRPGLHRRRTTARTRYIDMLLVLDTISPAHNISASPSIWTLLAAYIVFPAIFTSLQRASYDETADTKLKTQGLATARNLPLP